jgi:uncharacterized damage-inducible protein DinB
MLAMLVDLFAHQAHADASLLNAIRRHEVAAQDRELRSMVHHILVAHRFWVYLGQGLPFVADEEAKVLDTIELEAARFQETRIAEKLWLDGLQESDLERVVESPFLPGQSIAVREGLMQACLHSQGHRAQCASRLRMLGGDPPRMEYIIWVKDRAEAVWAKNDGPQMDAHERK